MVRLLANLSRWLQRHALTAMDLNEQRVDAFLQDRYQGELLIRRKGARHDRLPLPYEVGAA